MTIGLGELLTFGIVLIGAFWTLLTLLFKQFQRSITKQFESLEADAKEWVRLERELLNFKADMPLHYVRREDYVRNQSVIEAKLDAVALKIENWQLKEVANK